MKKICCPTCIPVFTGKPSYEDWIEVIKGLKRRRTVMTEAKTRGFCKEVGIDIGYFNGILPRSCKEASKCL